MNNYREDSKEPILPDDSVKEENEKSKDESSLPVARSESQGSVETRANLTLKFWPFIFQSSTIAFPGMFFYLSLLLLQTINLAFIGQRYHDDDMINAIGITNLYMNCTLMSIYTGLISGIETLCANAFAVKKYKLMGYYFQRARIVGYFVTIIIATFHFFTVQHVLRLFGLDEKVIEYSSHYIYSCLIYVFFDVQTSCIFRLLNVLEKSHINFLILLITLVFHPLWNYICAYKFDLGVIGAGISFTISKFLGCVLATLYLWFYHPVPESNFWINKKCFGWKGIKNYLKFSIGSAFLMCAEWWGFELLAIIAIKLGSEDYTVYVLVAEICGLLYSLPVGFMLSITIQVGEFIAKSSIRKVKLACVYSILFGMFSMVCYIGIFLIVRNKVFRIFTQEENILEIGYSVLPIMGCSEFFDFVQTSLVSIFRGIGKQYTASIFMFCHYYLIMPSLCILFGYWFKLGVRGMWYGIALSDITASTLYLIAILCVDFKKAQEETIERLKKDNALTAGVGESNNDEDYLIYSDEDEENENQDKEGKGDEKADHQNTQEDDIILNNSKSNEKTDDEKNDADNKDIKNREKEGPKKSEDPELISDDEKDEKSDA